MPKGGDLDVDLLLRRIETVCPDLKGAPHNVLAEGWDSFALEITDRIFKFPRSAGAETSLLREAAILDIVAEHVSLPVPRLHIHDRETAPFSQHRKLPGEHLLRHDYERLEEGARDELARRLAEFYTQVHAIPLARVKAAGIGPVEALPEPEWLELRVGNLPPHLTRFAARAIAEWRKERARSADLVFGHFDGHGWNMAFDHERAMLHGVYDFGDCGIGERHRDFSYANWVHYDLTNRIIGYYEESTGYRIDRARVHLYTSVLRLWEHLQDDGIANSLETLESWALEDLPALGLDAARAG